MERRLWRPDDFLKTLLTKSDDPLLVLPEPELPLDVGVGARDERPNLEMVSGRDDSHFFTPISLTYTSSPLDGAAWNYDVWIHFIPASLCQRKEEKLLGMT